MIEIPLTLGKFALIDDDDYDKISCHKWCFQGNKSGYAVRGFRIDGKSKTVLMHRVVLDVGVGYEVDHKNGNRLDNTKSNLRTATRKENSRNRNIALSNSGYKGVNWHKVAGMWRAYITVNYKYIHLGCFRNVIDAARAYNNAALEYFGEFATLNQLGE